MAQIIKEISVEVAKPNFIQAIVAKQYDNKSRYLKVTLVDEKKKISIAPTSTVTINAKRKDGTKDSFAGETNSDGTATVPLTYWMLELDGTVHCDVSVIGTDGKKLTSTKFDIEVERASCDNNDISEDENYDVLIKLIEDVNAAKSNVANAIKGYASGNPILIDDATPFAHPLDIKAEPGKVVCVGGKNLIPFDNKSYYNGRYVVGQTYEINGVSFTINNDGSVYAKGTATSPTLFYLYKCSAFKTGIHTVTLSGSPEGASSTTYCLRLEKENAIGAYGAEDYGSGKTIENVSLEGCSVQIVVFNGQSVDATFYPMVEFGDTASEFVSPVAMTFAIADNNGVVNELVSVGKEMSIFTDTATEIECVYNRDTEKAIEKYINNALGGIENGSY